MPLTDEELLALAPLALRNYRTRRYHAEERAVPLVSFNLDDRELIVALYELLRAVITLTGTMLDPAATRDDDRRVALVELLRRHGAAVLLERVRRLGRGLDFGTVLAETVHDIRGGALGALCVELEMAVRPAARADSWRSIFLLARDQAKVMRSLIADVDPEGRRADLTPKKHTTGHLATALRAFSGEIEHQQVALDVDCREDLPIAEKCVELGAVDRAIYNLLNNAVRHASGPALGVWILPVGESVRFVVANPISSEQETRLRPLTKQGALPLGYTSTGSGIGLSLVSDLVGSAYGLSDPAEVVAGGYYGATILPGSFVTWFHWPRVTF